MSFLEQLRDLRAQAARVANSAPTMQGASMQGLIRTIDDHIAGAEAEERMDNKYADREMRPRGRATNRQERS